MDKVENKYIEQFSETFSLREATNLYVKLSRENPDDYDDIVDAYQNWTDSKAERWNEHPFVCAG